VPSSSRVDAPADAVARLQDGDPAAGVGQPPRRHQPAHARADDDHIEIH